MMTCHLLDAVEFRADKGHGGAVTLIQRFGSATNLNIHLHCLVLDEVYRCDADGSPALIEADAPTDDELHALLRTVIARLMKMLTRRGVLVEEMRQTCLADSDADGEEARTQRLRGQAFVVHGSKLKAGRSGLKGSGAAAGRRCPLGRGAPKGHIPLVVG